MKLVLTSEVANLGGPGDVVEVKDGYGRNYLLPQGYAMLATRGVEKQVAQLRRAREVRAVRDLDTARGLASQLAGLRVRVTARAGSEGRLFGSITPADLVDAVVAAGGPKLDRRRLNLPGTVKTTGAHTATVRLHDDVVASVPFEVVAG